MKMYILVRDSIPISFALVGVAHASLVCYIQFSWTVEMDIWKATSFKKVICKVSDEEFKQAKKVEDNVLITESSLDDEEIALAFCPRNEWPEEFKKYKLY